MNPVLIDTVGFLALWNSKGPWHDVAAESFGELMAVGTDFVTTSYILLECGNSAARTRFRSDVMEVRRQLYSDGKVSDATEVELDLAWAAYDRGEAGSAGIVDHISFIIMRRLGITDAFTNDRHFRAAGFKTLF
jgi:predicted nucleic acid-binding protein